MLLKSSKFRKQLNRKYTKKNPVGGISTHKTNYKEMVLRKKSDNSYEKNSKCRKNSRKKKQLVKVATKKKFTWSKKFLKKTAVI